MAALGGRAMARLWLVRQGKHGEYEQKAVEENILTLDFGITEDISHLKTRDELIELMAELHPSESNNTHRNFAAQVNQFLNTAKTLDLVVSPMKTSRTIYIGRFTGPARAGDDGALTRPVEWLRRDVSRDSFKQDLLYSFGAFMTVCEISRNNAISRVEAVIQTGRDPGDGAAPLLDAQLPTGDDDEVVEASDQPIDLSEIARDQIERRVGSSFVGHDFTRLVAAILRVQGYVAHLSPKGPDSGIDIVAGSGALGLESPKIVVQVKSGDFAVDQPTLQALIGSIQDVQADHGLIVSWGGFTSAVRRRVNELYFRVRLWGREELIENLFSAYDRLPEDIRAELPLKRIWSVVLEEESED